MIRKSLASPSHLLHGTCLLPHLAIAEVTLMMDMCIQSAWCKTQDFSYSLFMLIEISMMTGRLSCGFLFASRGHTMRFGSTAKVLLKCKLKYYGISGWDMAQYEHFLYYSPLAPPVWTAPRAHLRREILRERTACQVPCRCQVIKRASVDVGAARPSPGGAISCGCHCQ